MLILLFSIYLSNNLLKFLICEVAEIVLWVICIVILSIHLNLRSNPIEALLMAVFVVNNSKNSCIGTFARNVALEDEGFCLGQSECLLLLKVLLKRSNEEFVKKSSSTELSETSFIDLTTVRGITSW